MSFATIRGRASGAAAIIAFVGASLAAAISPASAAPPANDNIANAQVIDGGPSSTTDGTNVDATIEAGEATAIEDEGGPGSTETAIATVWYTWLPEHSGPATFDVTSAVASDKNMFIAVGQTIGGRFIANDDSGVGVDPRVTVNATAGERLSIAVGQHTATAGTAFTLKLSQLVSPATVINGNSGKDVINGTPGDDIINGKGGNDVINGGGGNDVINGGAGNDTITGGPGKDVLNGGSGKDKFFAQDGFIDQINGGSGKNRLLSFDANDVAARVRF